MKKYIELCPTHSKFVKEVLNAPNSHNETEELKYIRASFETWNHGKLLCMLINPQYYDNSNVKQHATLLEYFLSFVGIINKSKRVKRIFCISAICDQNEQIDKNKAKWMFDYILVNLITGVEVCVFDDRKMKYYKELSNFKIDYVIGLHPVDDNNLYSKRTLFLSYEEKPEVGDEKDMTIICRDQIMANLFEGDFYQRLRGSRSDGRTHKKYKRVVINNTDFVTIKENRKQYDYKSFYDALFKIASFIGLNEEEIWECVNEIKLFITSCEIDEIQRDKAQLISSIEELLKIKNNTKKKR